MSEWISADSNMPALYEIVIVYCKAKCDKKLKVNLAIRTQYGWDSLNQYLVIKEVSHWMPLPEPPKE